MGNWGYGLFEGDKELDIMDTMSEILKLEGVDKCFPFDYLDEEEQIRSKLEENSTLIMQNDFCMEHPMIVCVGYMVFGAKIPDVLILNSLENANRELSEESLNDWEKPEERQKAIFGFLENLQTYKPGTRVKIDFKGLFEVLEEKLIDE